jgi:hypothetical protein
MMPCSRTAGLNVDSICLAGSDTAALQINSRASAGAFKTWPGARVFRVNAIDRKAPDPSRHNPSACVPFADAGGTGARYKVWLRPLPHSIEVRLRPALRPLPAPMTLVFSFTAVASCPLPARGISILCPAR